MVWPQLLGTAWHSVTTTEGTYRLPMHGSEMDSCQGVPADGKAAAMLFLKSPSLIPLASRAAATAVVSSCRPQSSLPILLCRLPDWTSKPPACDSFNNVSMTVSVKHAISKVTHTTTLPTKAQHHSILYFITLHSFVTVWNIPFCASSDAAPESTLLQMNGFTPPSTPSLPTPHPCPSCFGLK